MTEEIRGETKRALCRAVRGDAHVLAVLRVFGPVGQNDDGTGPHSAVGALAHVRHEACPLILQRRIAGTLGDVSLRGRLSPRFRGRRSLPYRRGHRHRVTVTCHRVTRHIHGVSEFHIHQTLMRMSEIAGDT